LNLLLPYQHAKESLRFSMQENKMLKIHVRDGTIMAIQLVNCMKLAMIVKRSIVTSLRAGYHDG